MTARTTAQRQAALRERRKKAGLAEVRGIWAPPTLHGYVKREVGVVLRKVERRSIELREFLKSQKR